MDFAATTSALDLGAVSRSAIFAATTSALDFGVVLGFEVLIPALDFGGVLGFLVALGFEVLTLALDLGGVLGFGALIVALAFLSFGDFPNFHAPPYFG